MPSCVLVVDDHPTNLKLACELLASEGYQVLSAKNADEVVSLLRQNSPDLILMDIALPGTDGLTLTRLLKAGAATRHIPIVALTASAMKGDDRKAFEAGCEGYITKPIDTRLFPHQIQQFLIRRTG